MNLLNNLRRLVLSAVGVGLFSGGVMCFSGCNPLDDNVQAPEEIQVSLRLDEAFQDKAHVRLNHEGTVDDYWYYMITEDLTSDAKELLVAKMSKELETTGALVGNVGTNKNLTFEGLQARTKYRVIAAIISPAGEIIGDVVSLEFSTLRDPDVFEVWPSWEITYKTRQVAPNDPNQETEIFTCDVKGDTTQTYIPCIISKSDFSTYYGSNLRRCFEDYVDYRDSFHIKWVDEVKKDNFEYTQDRMFSGDYMLFMIGVDTAGKLTGYYSKTEFKLKQETASKAYEAWVGSWTLKGQSLHKDEAGNTVPVEYTVDIVPTENNLYFELYGFDARTMESLSDIPQTIPLTLYFEKSSGDIYVISEQLPDIKDNQALADLYDFFAYGTVEVVYNDIPTVIPVDMSNMRIARFSMTGTNRAQGFNTSVSIDLYGSYYNTEFVAFNYYYEALGLFNYILESSQYVLRTNTITLTKN